RQVAHFVGDHGEAAALFTRARCLDGGVERQQVGLLGNAANGDEDGVDVLAVPGQVLHHAHGAADLAGQCRDGRRGFLYHLLALIGRLVGVVGCFGGMGGVACDVLGGGGHFVHGGGDQLDLGQLLLHALVGANGDVGRVL